MPERFSSAAPTPALENPFRPELKRVEPTINREREEQAEAEFLEALLWRDFATVRSMGKRLHLSEETQQEMAREAFTFHMQGGYLYEASKLAQEWRMTRQEMRSIVDSTILALLEQGRYPEVLLASRLFDVSQTFLGSERVREAAKGGIVSVLERGWLPCATSIAQHYRLEGHLQSVSGREALKHGLKRIFLEAPSKEDQPEDEIGEESASIAEALEFLEAHGLPMEIMHEGARAALREAMEARNPDALKILALLPKDVVPSEDLIATRENFDHLTDMVVSAIRSNETEVISKIKGYFPQDFLQQPSIQAAAEVELRFALNPRDSSDASTIKNIISTYEMPENVVRGVVHSSLVERIDQEKFKSIVCKEFVDLLEMAPGIFQQLPKALRARVMTQLTDSTVPTNYSSRAKEADQLARVVGIPKAEWRKMVFSSFFPPSGTETPDLENIILFAKHFGLSREERARVIGEGFWSQCLRRLIYGMYMSAFAKELRPLDLDPKALAHVVLKAIKFFYENSPVRTERAKDIAEAFHPPEDKVQEIIFRTLHDHLRRADMPAVMDCFSMVKDAEALIRATSASDVMQAIVRGFKAGEVVDALRVVEAFRISKNALKSAVVGVFQERCTAGDLPAMSELERAFPELSKRFESELQRWILLRMEVDTPFAYAELFTLFPSIEPFFSTPAVQSRMPRRIGHLLAASKVDVAIEEFSLSKIKLEDVKEVVLSSIRFFLRKAKIGFVAAVQEGFHLTEKDVEPVLFEVIEEFLHKGLVKLAVELNAVFDRPHKELRQLEEIFGEFVTSEIYQVFHAIQGDGVYNVNQRQELEKLGVRSTGPVGISELKRAFQDFRHSLVGPQGLNAELLLTSPMVLQYFKGLVRFETSQWGSHADVSFRTTIETYQKKKEALRLLPEELVASEVIRVKKIDSEAQEAYQPTEDAKARLLTFAASIEKALQLRGNVEELQKLFIGMREKRDVLIAALKEKFVGQENEKARAALERRIQDLHAVDFDQLTAPQKMFSVLASHGDVFAQDLRALVFWASLNVRPEQELDAREKIATIKRGSHPVDTFSWAVDFIDHITNKEVLRQYFTDKQAAEAFKKLLNVKALEEELVRAQKQGTKGTAPFMFVPQRNLLTEFSGHIADACWASKYDSMLEQFPNFSSMLIVSNPEDPRTMRFAGAAMLIETNAADGTPLLVIRGLNPQQNVINSLQPKDFLDQVFAYLRPLAEKMGRKLAIVIDDHSGGSGTNRPVLFTHLSWRKARMQPVRLASSQDTSFNNYNITNVTYLAD